MSLEFLHKDVIGIILSYVPFEENGIYCWKSIFLLNRRFRLYGYEYFDLGIHNNKIFLFACDRQYIEMVKLLLKNKTVNPKDLNNDGFRIASFHGNVQLAELLLQNNDIDINEYDSRSLRLACKNGHYNFVRFLIRNQKIDLWDYDNDAIKEAYEYGHLDIFYLLLQDNRINPFGYNFYEFKFLYENHMICYLWKGKIESGKEKRICSLLSPFYFLLSASYFVLSLPA